ncbi:hypothetical protein Smp_157180 [Schistosoma mansoni]|uniref:hypothetical protein n=1 Tax=Schistosoma mansoni TaxID=6183 RepID=UPI0001A630E6|nr:hypothetical protein Smp_157180 [Schistosoma mansoni]|eukprot:XP_018655034.1 hypothetical protein Smp_157180 [Schistosoma mansoni]
MLSFVEQEFGVVCTKIVHSPCDGQINCDTEDECLNSSDRFTETSSRCDDFEGNPLKIEKIANLSIESSFTDSQKESVKPRSRFFDFRGLKPLEKYV